MKRKTGKASEQSNGSGNADYEAAREIAIPLEDQLQEALREHRAGRPEIAERLYRRILAIERDHTDALQLLGLLYKQLGKLEGAASLMRQSLTHAPAQPAVHNNLGNVFSRLGKKTEAIASYRKAIDLKKDYPEPWYNLGIELRATGDAGEAIEAYLMATAIKPDYTQAFDELGNAYKDQGMLDEAIVAYNKALEITPDNFKALHNLGVALRMSGQLEEAVACFRKILAANPDIPEAHYNLGNALILLERLDEAEASYETALQLKPDFKEAHYDLNQLLWTQGRHGEFLQSYPAAIKRKPDSLELWLQYVDRLIPAQAFVPAEETLRKALQRFGPTAELYDLLAKTLSIQGREAEALEFHNKCLELDETTTAYLCNYGQTLLKFNETEAALEIFDLALAIDPLGQELIAYRGDCLRLLGDERHDILNDYEGMIRLFEPPLPGGYNDREAFTRDLNRALDPLHSAERFHPMDQTLQGGSQSRETLFDQDIELVQLYKQSLRQVIAEYIYDLDDDATHPLFSRKCQEFSFSGSFTVRLRNGGYHTNHIHPAGWLSCCFYVSLPPVVADTSKREGWIHFGQPGVPLKPKVEPIRYVQPQEGVVAVFPSYLWHATTPFNSNHTRTTIVADIVPND